MAKLDEPWDPIPRRLIAALSSAGFTAERQAPDIAGWAWAFRQLSDRIVPSVRDLCAFTGWGNRRAARVLDDVINAWNSWNEGGVVRQEQHHARKSIYSAPRKHLLRTSSAPTAHLSESVVVDVVDEARTTSARRRPVAPARHRLRRSPDGGDTATSAGPPCPPCVRVLSVGTLEKT